MANGSSEMLHRLVGSVDVARHMIERSAGMYRRANECDHLEVVIALFDAAETLRVVAEALEAELRPRALVGPAA